MEQRPIVVGAGELLWDCYPDRRRPGGAPANVAFHAQQLGLAGVVFSRVGQDELGAALCAHLQEHEVPTTFVQTDPRHPTGCVTVDLAVPDQPVFTIEEDAAWDHLELTDAVRELAGRAAAICFGTLAQRNAQSRAAIHELLSCVDATCVTVYDINLRPPWYERSWIEESLRAARIVKLNAQELVEVAALLEVGSDDPINVARHFQSNYQTELVCVTRSAQGCILIDRNGVAMEDGVAVADVDPVGAGDAFTAALIFGHLRQWSLQVRAIFANQIAALVAGREGAMPKLAAEFAAEMSRFH
jgi:fructokinase